MKSTGSSQPHTCGTRGSLGFRTDGRFHRVLPEVAHGQVQAAVTELSAPRYAPALALAKRG